MVSSKCGYIRRGNCGAGRRNQDRTDVTTPRNYRAFDIVAFRCDTGTLRPPRCTDTSIPRTAQKCFRVDPRSKAQIPRRRDSPDDPCRIAQPRVFQDCRGRRRTIERHGFGTEGLGQAQRLNAPVARRFAEALHGRGLHRHHCPLGVERVGETLAETDQCLSLIVRRHSQQETVAR